MPDGLVPVPFSEQWRQLCSGAGWRCNVADIGADLLGRYAEPHRAYHNQLHLQECLDELSAVPNECDDRVAVATALWFHDAIYDPARSDNESASADLAAERLSELGESPDRIPRVRELIMDTVHRSEPASIDGRIIVDIDLAIFGKTADRFDNYDSSIRFEYAHVPDDAYRTGRLAILRRFLSRLAIYRTPLFVERYECLARANLFRAIARLEQEPKDSGR